MADEKITYHGVYLPDGDGLPAAIFRDGDAAQRYRMTLDNGATGLVAEVESVSVGRSAAVADHFKALTDAVPTPAVPDPDAPLRGEIRAQLEMDERRARLTEEVKRDMAKDDSEHPEPARPVVRPVAAPASAQGR